MGKKERVCPKGWSCLPDVGDNPNFGYTSFDNFLWSMLTTFQLITLDFWEDVYNKVIATQGPLQVGFFAIVVFFGSFYLINLMLAVVAMISIRSLPRCNISRPYLSSLDYHISFRDRPYFQGPDKLREIPGTSFAPSLRAKKAMLRSPNAAFIDPPPILTPLSLPRPQEKTKDLMDHRDDSTFSFDPEKLTHAKPLEKKKPKNRRVIVMRRGAGILTDAFANKKKKKREKEGKGRGSPSSEDTPKQPDAPPTTPRLGGSHLGCEGSQPLSRPASLVITPPPSATPAAPSPHPASPQPCQGDGHRGPPAPEGDGVPPGGGEGAPRTGASSSCDPCTAASTRCCTCHCHTRQHAGGAAPQQGIVALRGGCEEPRPHLRLGYNASHRQPSLDDSGVVGDHDGADNISIHHLPHIVQVIGSLYSPACSTRSAFLACSACSARARLDERPATSERSARRPRPSPSVVERIRSAKDGRRNKKAGNRKQVCCNLRAISLKGCIVFVSSHLRTREKPYVMYHRRFFPSSSRSLLPLSPSLPPLPPPFLLPPFSQSLPPYLPSQSPYLPLFPPPPPPPPPPLLPTFHPSYLPFFPPLHLLSFLPSPFSPPSHPPSSPILEERGNTALVYYVFPSCSFICFPCNFCSCSFYSPSRFCSFTLPLVSPSHRYYPLT
ncbi:putative sodium channel protein 60E [Penaeus vannamei]|uniref:Putative sodium channel protein 60E n=1 Tax=Penaeus vannamei TaxID=6689 RepID=A0A423SQR1_PENVA|nr:putative sodium channel protein 60E [Penaeus vannamei]